MGLISGLNLIVKTGTMLTKRAENIAFPATKSSVSPVIKARESLDRDIFESSTICFDDIWEISKSSNEKIRISPKKNVNDKSLKSVELPEYLYHMTSEQNFKKIQSSNTLRCSENEHLQGVYLFDKTNFLTHYNSVGAKKYNLCQSLLCHANVNNNGSGNLVIIRIPTESLIRNGNIRIRTQEDFFYFEYKIQELQKDLKKKFSLRDLAVSENRELFKQYVLHKGLMSKKQIDKFMKEMQEKIHSGYSIYKLAQLEKRNAIEYIFDKDINPNTIKGISCRKFSIHDLFKGSEEIDLTILEKILS